MAELYHINKNAELMHFYQFYTQVKKNTNLDSSGFVLFLSGAGETFAEGETGLGLRSKHQGKVPAQKRKRCLIAERQASIFGAPAGRIYELIS